jgi:hypothetical protein
MYQLCVKSKYNKWFLFFQNYGICSRVPQSLLQAVKNFLRIEYVLIVVLQVAAQCGEHTRSTSLTVTSLTPSICPLFSSYDFLLSSMMFIHWFLPLQNKWPCKPIVGSMVWGASKITRLRVQDTLICNICCWKLQDCYLTDLWNMTARLLF